MTLTTQHPGLTIIGLFIFAASVDWLASLIF